MVTFKPMPKRKSDARPKTSKRVPTKSELAHHRLSTTRLGQESSRYFVNLVNGETGQAAQSITLPTHMTSTQLNEMLNQLNQDELPYSFYVDGLEMIRQHPDSKTKDVDTIQSALFRLATNRKEVESRFERSTEDEPLKILYYPESIFRVRSVTRCTSTLPGHSEAILSVQFSPDGRGLATASGDATVRLWDLSTQTPLKTLQGHQDWVLCVSWSPNAQRVASGGRDSIVKVWTRDGNRACKPLRGHRKWITSISWEPYHLNVECQRLATSSKDGTIRIWNVVRGLCEGSLTGHTHGVSCVKWNGDGTLFSSSQDCTIRQWCSKSKTLLKLLKGHAHWVNTMALSTDYALRRGAFDEMCEELDLTDEQEKLKRQKEARERYERIVAGTPLRIISGSDDNTLCLWEPDTNEKPIGRLMGHQGVVNQVAFSPNGRFIASASFDKTVRLWEASNGQFIHTFRGHVGPVFQVAWSGDSRLIVSCSKDSTGKVWDVETKQLLNDLPGHYDEVYSIDWAPNGQKVASGGKDRVLKLWGR